MKRWNLRLVAILIICPLLVAVTVHLLHRFQIRRNAGVLMAQGRDARSTGRLNDALEPMRRYVALVPEDLDALEEFGDLLFELGVRDGRPALSGQGYLMLSRVLLRDAKRDGVRRKVVDLAIAIQRFADAQSHIEHLLNKDPQDAELLDKLGLCQTAGGDYQPAEQSFLKSIEFASDRLDTYVRLASLYQRYLDQQARADDVIRDMVRANPESPRAYTLRGNFWRSQATARNVSPQKRELLLQAAKKDAGEALKRSADDPAGLLLAAQCAQTANDLAEAQALLQRAIERNPLPNRPNSVALYLTMAAVTSVAGKTEDSIRWLRRGLAEMPGERNLQWFLADMLIGRNELDAVPQIIGGLRRHNHPEPTLLFLEGRAAIQRNEWRAARDKLEAARPGLIAWPDLAKQADVLLGQCFGQLGDYDLQLAAYRRALATDNTYVAARLGIASALVALGRLPDAIEEYQTLIGLNLPGFPTARALDLARLMILQNKQMLQTARRAPDWQRVTYILDRVEENLPDAVDVPLLRAEVLIAQGDQAAAEALLAAAQRKHPDRAELPVAVAALAARSRDWHRAEEILNHVEQTFGDSLLLRLSRAQYYVSRKGTDAGDDLQALAEHADGFRDEDRVALYRGLIQHELRIGAFHLATEMTKHVAKLVPNDLRLRLLLFDLALRAKDDAAMQQALADVRRIEGTGAPHWRYGQAVRQIILYHENNDPATLEAARTHVEALRAARPGWAAAWLLSAQIAELREDEDAMIDDLLQAVELGATRATAIQKLVVLLHSRQRYEETARVINHLATQEDVIALKLGRMASDVSLRLDDLERAVILARKNAASTQDYRDYIWLGMVLGRDRTNDAEAEAAFRRAVALNDQVPESWTELTQFLANREKIDEAKGVIADAAQRLPIQLAPLALARCHEAIGDIEQAQSLLTETVAERPDDAQAVRNLAEFYLRYNKAKEAEVELRKIVSQKVSLPAREVQGARRGLAIVLSTRADESSLREAVALIERNLSEDSSSIQDIRAKATVIASRSYRAPMRREAMQLFRTLVDDQRFPEASDRFALAQLYLADGRWDDFRKQMGMLLSAGRVTESTDQRIGQYMASYARALLNHGDLSEAELWIRRLTQVASVRNASLRLQSQLFVLRKQPQRALAAVKQLLADNAKDASHLLPIAVLQEQLGSIAQQTGQQQAAASFASEAETVLRKLAGDDLGNAAPLAAFLARQGRLDDSIEELARIASQTETGVVQAAGVLMQQQSITSAHLERLEVVLQPLVQQHPDSVGVLLVLADIYAKSYRYDDAERAYRHAIDLDQKSYVALNNLAVLLALRGENTLEALEMIQRAIELVGPQSVLLDTQGTVLMALNRPDRATKVLAQAIEDSPNAPVYYFHHAQALYAAGNSEAAAEAMQRSNDLGLRPEMLHHLEKDAYDRLLQLVTRLQLVPQAGPPLRRVSSGR